MKLITENKSKLHVLIEEIGVISILKNAKSKTACIELEDHQMYKTVKNMVTNVIYN